MSARTVTSRAVLVLMLAVVPVLAGASMLHLKLARSEPSANAVLTASPTQVKLWFTQKPELTVTSIKVRSRSGTAPLERTLAPLARGSAADAPITASVGAALASGHYQVVWRTMARDGHVLNGVIPFDVR